MCAHRVCRTPSNSYILYTCWTSSMQTRAYLAEYDMDLHNYE